MPAQDSDTFLDYCLGDLNLDRFLELADHAEESKSNLSGEQYFLAHVHFAEYVLRCLREGNEIYRGEVEAAQRDCA